MKKQKVQLIVVVVILVLCIAGYFVAGRVSQKETTEDEETEYIAFSFDSASLEFLMIEGERGTLELAYDSGSWSFVQEIEGEDSAEYEVNDTTADAILGYLDELTSSREITVEEEDLSQYGFDDPSMTITITLDEGEQHIITFGDCNEMLDEYYFYVDDSNLVYTLESYTYNILNKSDADLAVETEDEEEIEEEEETEEEETGEAEETQETGE